MTTKHKPQPADKWLATIRDTRHTFGSIRRADGPYAYATDGALLLAIGQPDSPLPANTSGNVVKANRAAAIAGSVTGLRAAVRPLKQFSADGGDRVTIRVNGRLDVSAECYAGSASCYIDGLPDGATYTHDGPDAEIGVNFKYLMQALDGLPETVTYRVHHMTHGDALGLSAIVDGQLREAIIAGLEAKK